MLPRPHILQPTDHRTFVQGLRVLEGIQDFFLIVQYPADLQALCVEVSLDTGHFPERVDIQQPEEAYEETAEDFWVEAYADNGFFSGQRKSFEQVVTAPAGRVVDRRKGDPGHAGCSAIQDQSNRQARDTLKEHFYGAVNDTTVSVSGTVKGASGWGPGAVFKRLYRAHFRSEKPLPSAEQPFVATPFLITNRRLSACIVNQEDCFFEVPPDLNYRSTAGDWVVGEHRLEIPGSVLTKSSLQESRTPALKALLREIEKGLVRSGRLRTRYPFGTVNYLASNHFLEQILRYVPKERRDRSVADAADIPLKVRGALSPETTIGQLIRMDLATLSGKLGISIEEAIALKKNLLQRKG